MGQVYEKFDSLAGGIIALDDAHVFRQVIVIVDLEGQIPSTFLPSVIPLGTAMDGRWPQYAGLVAYAYHEGERIGKYHWNAAIEYRPPSDVSTLGWISEGEFTDEQEEITFDETRDADGNWTPKLIGSYDYEAFTPASGVTPDYVAKIRSGAEIAVQRVGQFVVRPRTRNRPVHRFRMTRVLRRLTWKMIRGVGKQAWTINNSKFIDFGRGELAFSNFGWREVPAPVVDGRSNPGGRQYEVSLQFAAHGVKWGPTELFELYVDEKGTKTPVYGPSVAGQPRKPISQFFEDYRYSDFGAIFDTLNAGAEATLSTGR